MYTYIHIYVTENECNEITKYFAIGFQVGPKERASYPEGNSGRRKYGKRGQERRYAAQWWWWVCSFNNFKRG